MNEKARYYIEKLKLNRHPEGGYFNEVYRSGEIFEADVLPGRYGGDRAFSTSIYYLLNGNDKSVLHRLKSDEIWHYYDGCPVKIYIISESGIVETRVLGSGLEKGEVLQTAIGKDQWFGAEPVDKKSFALLGCTVSPGFDFDDFEAGRREELLQLFPHLSDIILKLT